MENIKLEGSLFDIEVERLIVKRRLLVLQLSNWIEINDRKKVKSGSDQVKVSNVIVGK